MAWDHEYDLTYLEEIDKNYEKFCAFTNVIKHYQPSIEQMDEAIEKSKMGVDGTVMSTMLRSLAQVPLVDEDVALPAPPHTLLDDEESVDSQIDRAMISVKRLAARFPQLSSKKKRSSVATFVIDLMDEYDTISKNKWQEANEKAIKHKEEVIQFNDRLLKKQKYYQQRGVEISEIIKDGSIKLSQQPFATQETCILDTTKPQ